MRSDSADESPRRGRPPSPAQNALGSYLRDLRMGRGWTIRTLARELGLPESSAGYISQLEAGTKSPHRALARKLADRLGDPKGIFPLWAQIGARNDPYRAALARRALAHVLGDPSINFDPRFSRPGRSRLERTGYGGAELEFRVTANRVATESWRQELRPISPEVSPEGYRYRVPVAPLDLHPYLVPREMEEMLTIQLPRRVSFPVAYRMDLFSVHRVRNIVHPGDVVVLARESDPIVEHEVYGVWEEAGLELAHVLFNGEQLLVLPAPGETDFVVHETRHPYRYVVGHMVTVVRPPSTS